MIFLKSLTSFCSSKRYLNVCYNFKYLNWSLYYFALWSISDADNITSSIGEAIASAVTSGSNRYFLGTDSAPHERRRKECTCGCAGIYNAPVALSLYAKVFEQVLP